MLKNAFIAACLAMGGVPDIHSANEIRAELMAVVTAKSRREVQLGPQAKSLRYFRTGLPHS